MLPSQNCKEARARAIGFCWFVAGPSTFYGPYPLPDMSSLTCCSALLFHSIPAATGNFPTVTRVLLEKIPVQDGKMTYVYDDYVFHYVVENGICYLCMSDEKNKHRIPFGFLEDMKTKFLTKFGMEAAQSAIAFAMNEDFKNIIAERMEFYNSEQADKGLDNIGVVKSQIDEVKDVMVQNIEKVLERGEKIELLVDKTDRLNQQAFRFESSSRALRRAMWWKKMRCYAIIGVISLLVIYAASVSLCGFNFHHCKAKKN
jgi:vesicle-associated membrane protein 7